MYQLWERHSLLFGNSLRTCFMQLTYCQRFFQWLSLIGSWQAKADFGMSCTFCRPVPAMVLVEVGFGLQLGPFHRDPCPAEAATNLNHLVAPNRKFRAGHMHCLIWTCGGVSPQGLQNQHSGWLQTTSHHGPVSTTSGTTYGRSQQASEPAGGN